MIVKELITELSKFSGNAEVTINGLYDSSTTTIYKISQKTTSPRLVKIFGDDGIILPRSNVCIDTDLFTG